MILKNFCLTWLFMIILHPSLVRSAAFLEKTTPPDVIYSFGQQTKTDTLSNENLQSGSFQKSYSGQIRKYDLGHTTHSSEITLTESYSSLQQRSLPSSPLPFASDEALSQYFVRIIATKPLEKDPQLIPVDTEKQRYQDLPCSESHSAGRSDSPPDSNLPGISDEESSQYFSTKLHKDDAQRITADTKKRLKECSPLDIKQYSDFSLLCTLLLRSCKSVRVKAFSCFSENTELAKFFQSHFLDKGRSASFAKIGIEECHFWGKPLILPYINKSIAPTLILDSYYYVSSAQSTVFKLTGPSSQTKPFLCTLVLRTPKFTTSKGHIWY